MVIFKKTKLKKIIIEFSSTNIIFQNLLLGQFCISLNPEFSKIKIKIFLKFWIYFVGIQLI